MVAKFILLLCFVPLLLVGSDLTENAQCPHAPSPSWIKTYEVPLEELSIHPSQVNLQYLLIDKQRNWEEKSLYFHFAAKVLSQMGAQEISQLQIAFDPAHYQVVMNTMRVFREGIWIDRLENSKSKTLQRETKLEQNLYMGELSLVYFLEDIREGDIVEYAYTILGESPLSSSHYADLISLERNASIEKLVYRLIGSPSLFLTIQPTNIDIQPQITDLSPSMREWIWEVNNTSPYVYEKNEPLWYNSKAHLQISQFTNWGEVAQKHYPYYVLPHNFSETIPPEMQGLVNQWKETTQDVYKRALLAVRFVQDKVRYLGIEEGVGRVQPNPPSMTFQRRFGDCKDKTFLLHALLRLMDIPSTPLLVHTNQGKRLPEALPFLFAFNHAVLQIEINGIPYFVDSTINLQGDSLETNFFPNFEWGLLLDPNTTTLTALPKVVLTKPAECESTIIIDTEDSARLKIKSTSYNSRADNLRRSLERNGLKKISKDFLSQMQEVYGMVSVDSPMKIVDDRENNILVLTESYHIPTQKLSDKKVLQVFSHILSNYLHNKVNPARTSPYALPYPLWIKESIHIENPFFEWNLLEEYYTQEHESLLYNLSTHIEGHHAQFDIELKHLQDHISQSALQDYWNIVKDIEWKALPRMIISSLDSQEKSNHSQTCSENVNN